MSLFLSCHADPLSFVLLFPDGRPGWSPGIPHIGPNRTSVRNTVTALQYYVYLIMIRPDVFNPHHHAGLLFQQKLVYDYCRVEALNLSHHRKRQQTLRVESLRGLHDHVNGDDDFSPTNHPGCPVFLPSSFNGSPRNMADEYHNSMAGVTKCGKPDLFITFTADIHWPEIQSALRTGLAADMRPDLISRVFHMYLDEFFTDVKDRQIFGRIVSHIFVIEFQKRGYPHAHILFHFSNEDKLRTPEDIDSFISARIPDPLTEPLLHELVVKFMMHGPCGDLNPLCPCMKDGQCSKKFPKEFCDETDISTRGYVKLRRPDDGVTIDIRGATLDNRWVVPYCPYLLMKFRCHINVEACQNLNGVKYLYKYIFKGHDCASVQITHIPGHAIDEIRDFVDGRFVSPPEAAYRLFEFKLKGRSHSVEKIPVHLPDMQPIFLCRRS